MQRIALRISGKDSTAVRAVEDEVAGGLLNDSPSGRDKITAIRKIGGKRKIPGEDQCTDESFHFYGCGLVLEATQKRLHYTRPPQARQRAPSRARLQVSQNLSVPMFHPTHPRPAKTGSDPWVR
jgi:hypothetical protein